MKLQQLSLTVRVKVNDTGYFPAVEVADVLESYIRHLYEGAYSASLEVKGTHLHAKGAVDWELEEVRDGTGKAPEDGQHGRLRTEGRHADVEESKGDHE